MRRHVLLFHLAQARSAPLGRRLNSKPPSEWPEHIKLAWAILRDELQVPQECAFKLLKESISEAQTCAEAVNRQSRNIVDANLRAKFCQAFKRLANCCRRAPTGLRQHLNKAVQPLLRPDPVDSEAIEALLEAIAGEFKRSSTESAATALRAMLAKHPSDGDAYNWLKNNYTGLLPEPQRHCEDALEKLGKNQNVKADMVFDALAAALKRAPTDGHSHGTVTLIANHVGALARLWEAAGLRPARAHREGDTSYKSRFHRYSDLILTAVAEPAALRHDSNLGSIRQLTYKVHAGMPPGFRVSAALRPSAAEWLISEYILRKGLRFQKQRRETP